MSRPSFVHLHVHSHYSLLDGLPRIPELVEEAKSQGMHALALTDHGALYGAVEFYRAAKAKGIKPIIGVETYLAAEGRHLRRPKLDERPFHVLLLAKNETGYRNLIKLITEAHLSGYYYKPRIDWELLAQYHEGLIALSGCLSGQLPQAILSGDASRAESLLEKYRELFGRENFFLEVQPHVNIPEQLRLNAAVFALAAKTKTPVVATSDVHYLKIEDADVEDTLLCIQTKTLKSDRNRLNLLGDNFSLVSGEAMAKAFADHPEVIENTARVAEACNLELPLGKIQLPFFAVPDGQKTEAYLEHLCRDGMTGRYGTNPPAEVETRLRYELSVIEKTGFASYFLIVHDFVRWAKEQGIVVGPGRGSAAGSLVAYLLKITNVDPLRYDLLFERFLNPDRVSMPDVDLDFADVRRDEVIRYVEGKYGKDHVAQIITFGTMAARAAVRDVGRALGLPYPYCDRVAKLIPMFMPLTKAVDEIPELKEIYESDPDGRQLLDSAMKLEGVARHTSTHASGVVITERPLTEYVPLQYAAQGDETILTQYSLHSIEDLGLLKMDFLGLRNLTTIERTLEIVEKAEDKRIDIDDISLTDPKTFALLQRGDTTGVFQLESSGMKRYIRELKPTDLEDIIAMVSLYRPGPMEFIPDYIAGKHGRRQATYLHPKLAPILAKTYGVAVYQEQLMQIARDLAGFTLGEADVLRKAVGKKIAKLLKEQREKFVEGCVANGIPKATAEKIFEFIEPFARYGFNRAHAACYALIAYQTAYLKANVPAAFMAALLTSEGGDVDRVAVLIEECEHLGLKVLPPDVNESYTTFTAVYDQETRKAAGTIRFGLSAIKNVGENLIRVIVHARKANGPYASLTDLLRRLDEKDLNRKSLEALAKSGALDSLGERRQILDNLEMLLKFARSASGARSARQANLFGSLPTAAAELKLRDVPPASKEEKLSWEKELLGLYLSDHPLREFRRALEGLATPIRVALEQPPRNRVRIAAVITQLKRILTRTQESMLFAKLEDESGRIETLVFPSILKLNPTLWQESKLVLVAGRLSDKDGESKLLADEATELNETSITRLRPAARPGGPSVARLLTISLRSRLSKEETHEIEQILKASRGPYRVEFRVQNGGGIRVIPTSFSVEANDRLLSALREKLGEEAINFQS